MIDLVLASAHHIVVFALVAVLAIEFALLRPGIAGPRLKQLARIDAAYGGIAVLVLIVGVLRVMFGAVGPGYYLGNGMFWAKMVAVIVIGLLSIRPTIAIIGWSKAQKGDAGFEPAASEIAGNRIYIHAQLGVMILVPIFAAAMARGYGS